MVVQPNALRNELALEIRRWYPANTWTEALAAADAAIAGLIAGDKATPVEHHPLVIFIANTFIVPWSWAGAAYNTILTGGVVVPPLVGFVTVWRTTAPAELVTVPVSGTGYSCVVNWGDGTPDTNYTTGVLSHTYTAAGDYTVTITGTFPKIRFVNLGDRLKLIKILNWGAVGWVSGGLQAGFYGCANLNEVSATDAVNLPGGDWSHAFRGCNSLLSLNLTGHPGGVTNLESFVHQSLLLGIVVAPYLCTASTTTAANFAWDANGLVTVQGMETWVTSGITSLAGMFRSADNANPNVSHFDVGLVTTASNMFTEPCALSDANYDALLIGWAAQSPDLKPAVPFNAGGAKYSAGAATSARAVLTGTHTWAIIDGGPAALLVSTSMPTPVVDFTVAPVDVDVLGNGWNVLTGSAEIGDGQCVVGPGGVRAVINSGSPNVVITAIVQAFAPVGLLLRSRVGGVRAMRVVLDPLDGSLALQRVDAGAVVTTLASAAVMPVADTTEHHVQVWIGTDNRYLVYFDGVLSIDMVETYQMNRPWHGILAGPGAVYLREFSIAEFPA